MKRLLLTAIFIISFVIGASRFSAAQCAMCKASAESSMKEGNKTAAGLNTGILYLLVMPYLLVGGIGYYWYVTTKKKANQQEEI